MKVSFAPFEQTIYFRKGMDRGTYTRIVYIDCDKITAVSDAIDSDGNLIDGKCDVIISDNLVFTVMGKPEAVMATVCSHRNGRTS